ncbi:MAG TPA: response regulator [Burkholderiales bacterium]|nr:response regulator [Burkholderiales bacterium]
MERADAPKVFIVDDDDAIRDSLAWLMSTRGLTAQAFGSAEEFLGACPEDAPGCLVLDMRMPGMSGLELHEKLLERGCTLPVIFLTGHADVPMAVAAIKRGAFDFVEKPFNDNALVDLVIKGIERDARARAQRAEKATVASRLAQLTPREREVMDLILAGRLNKLIADELNISMRTVEVHRSRVLEKMGVRSAVELAQLIGPRAPNGGRD